MQKGSNNNSNNNNDYMVSWEGFGMEVEGGNGGGG